MKQLKCFLCLCLISSLLLGCQKNNIELIHEQITVELGQPIIEDVTAYIDTDSLTQTEKEDIQKNGKLIVEGQKDIFQQVGEYKATIKYHHQSVNFSIVVKDTTFPVIHSPSTIYTPINKVIDYSKYIQIEDKALQRKIINDEDVNIHKVGTYPLHIMTYDETGNCVRQDVTVQVGGTPSTLASSIYLDIPYYNQMDVNAPNGCEATALYMALKYKNKVSNDLKTFIQNQPIGETPYLGFAGNPFQTSQHSYDYYTIFPSALAHYGNQFQPTYDISGYSLKEIKQELSEDHPVIVWLTGGMNNPSMKTYYFGEVVGNLHIVLLNGYDDKKQVFYVQDPIDETIKSISYEQFLKIYNKKTFAISVH